jgi:16S rRNA (cytosine967-C5)-methyltransferase
MKERIDRRDKRLAFEIVYGVIRNRLRIDFILDDLLDDEHFKAHKQLKRMLEIGVYQIVFLDKIPEHAAVNESVILAKDEKATRQFSGVINAVLRKVIRLKNRLPKPKAQETLEYRLSITYSHPQWLIRRWLKHFGLSNTKKLLEFNNTHPKIFLRRKIKGVNKHLFENDIRGVCDASKGGSGYKNLYYVIKKSILPEEVSLFKEGWCTVQAESSGWVTALLDLKEGEIVLDVCAAPGGKAGLISELVGKEGIVFACELHIQRLIKIRETAIRMKLPNMILIACDGTALPFSGSFNKVLLDAPCIATGVLHRHPEARWYRTPEDIVRMSSVQEKLLHAVAPSIAKNGILVYATCSLEPEENQLQIEHFIEKHPEFVVENANAFVKESFVDDKGFLSILPFEHKLDGMFAARLRKISD